MRTYFLLLAISVIFISCENEDEEFHKITYRVEGNFSILDSLFYEIPIEGLQKQGATLLYWEHSFWAEEGERLKLMAMADNYGKGGKEMRVEILIDEELVFASTEKRSWPIIKIVYENGKPRQERGYLLLYKIDVTL